MPAQRIWRDAYVLHIGDQSFDMDELRNYFVHDMVEPALLVLCPPPTDAEIAQLTDILGIANASHWTKRMFSEMLERLQSGK